MPSAGAAEMHGSRSQSDLGRSTHDHGTESPGLGERGLYKSPGTHRTEASILLVAVEPQRVCVQERRRC